MKAKIAGWIFLVAALTELMVNLPKVWEMIKMIDRTIILETALIVTLIIAGAIYLLEKYKEFKNILQSLLLIIDSAEYGAGGQTNDVTHILWARIVSGRIENFPVTNQTLGPDPIPHVGKTLTVRYKYLGEPRSISVPEYGTLSIPE